MTLKSIEADTKVANMMPMRETLTETDQKWLRRAFEIASRSLKAGNPPFGALLVDPDGTDVLLEGESTIVTDNDATAHADLNIIRQASRIFEPDFLVQCTLYTNTEPCPMCVGAIYWSGVGRVVYGLSADKLKQIISSEANAVNKPFNISARELLSRAERPIALIGPSLEEEALKVHEGQWLQFANMDF